MVRPASRRRRNRWFALPTTHTTAAAEFAGLAHLRGGQQRIDRLAGLGTGGAIPRTLVQGVDARQHGRWRRGVCIVGRAGVRPIGVAPSVGSPGRIAAGRVVAIAADVATVAIAAIIAGLGHGRSLGES